MTYNRNVTNDAQVKGGMAMTSNPGLSQEPGMSLQAAQTRMGLNLKRLRCAAMITQKALADAMNVDVGVLSATELGYGVLPIRAFLPLATAFGISFQELVVELGKDTHDAEAQQMVSGMGASTAHMREIIRLRDALELERENASRQFEFLAKRNGMHDIFTREAASRMERLDLVLGLDLDASGGQG